MPTGTRLVVVDDELPQLNAICSLLEDHGFEVVGIPNPTDALEYLKHHRCDLLLTDLKLPMMSGIELITQAIALDPQLSTILMTGHASIETAIEALQLGVQDYVLKPFKFSTILPVINKALNFRKLKLENEALLNKVTHSNQQLKELNTELDSFAGRVAHDLNSIIHLIGGYASSLGTRANSNLSEHEIRNVTRIQETSARGAQLVSDLLSFARLGTGELQTTQIDLRLLVSRAKVIAELEHDGPRPEWDIGELPTVSGDEGLLERVFVNLFSNALKFSRNKPVPLVEVNYSECDEYIHVSVKDNGAGFEPHLAKNLFKPFLRLHSNHEFEGHGMGLANVKKIMECHQGQVKASSVPGTSTVFQLSFPKEKILKETLHKTEPAPGKDRSKMELEIELQLQNISEQKKVLSTADRINSLLQAQSQVNVAIPGFTSTDQMFEEVCRLAPTLGKIPLVWVVKYAENEQSLRVVAKGGVHLDLVEEIMSSINGPLKQQMAEYLFTKQVYVCEDVRNDPYALAWKDKAIEKGLESYAVMPLHLQGKLHAAMIYFGNGTSYFDAPMRELLQTIAKNRSLGLENLVHGLEKIQTLERLQLLETCIERLNEMVLITDAESVLDHGPVILYANKAYYERTGYTPEDVIGNTPAILNGQLTSNETMARIRAALANKEAIREELVNYTKTGESFWMEIDIVPISDSTGKHTNWVSIQRDISDRKTSEGIREEHLNRFRSLANATSDCIWDWDLINNDHIWWSDGLVKIFGYEPEQIESTIDSWTNRIHPEDLQRVIGGVERTLISANNNWSDEYRFAKADGSWAVVVDRGYVIRDEQGNAIRMIGGLTDVSHLVQVTRQIESQLLKMNLLNDVTRAIVKRLDIDSIYNVVVQALEQDLPSDFSFMGTYQADKQIVSIHTLSNASKNLAAIIDVDDFSEFKIAGTHLEEACTGEFVHQADMAVSSCPIAREMQARLNLNSVVIVPLTKGNVVMGVMVTARREAKGFLNHELDFLKQLGEHVSLALGQASLLKELQSAHTELTQTQDMVLQQERLQALAEMAGGIAHDINNAISPATLYVESVLLTEKQMSEKGRRQLETVQIAIDDVANTVERMGRFAKGKEVIKGKFSTNVNDLCLQVKEFTKVRWNTLSQKQGISIFFETQLDPKIHSINISESEIREALINLVFNSIDALPKGGTITITTKLEQTDDSHESNNLLISVNDDGIGMTEEACARCLEPFYTTKGERGTGLGLSMVYGITKRQNGFISVDSIVGNGTTVTLNIPISKEKICPTAINEKELNDDRRSRKVLIVDDDAWVLESLDQILGECGHSITAVNNGQKAIEELQNQMLHNAPFDLVITDLGMPNMNGSELAQRIKALSPNIYVVLLTGWATQLNSETNSMPWVDAVLGKPPRRAELLKIIQELRNNPKLISS